MKKSQASRTGKTAVKATKAGPKKEIVIEGVHSVRRGQKCGVNNSDEVLLPPVYDIVFPVEDGLLAVEQGKCRKFVSNQGEVFDVSDETRANIVVRLGNGDGFRWVSKEERK